MSGISDEDFLLAQLGEARASASGCGLCGLEARQASRYLEGVANDGVNDVPLREQLAGDGGYCPLHAAEFRRFANPLAAAILLGAILEARLERVRAGRKERALRCEACRVAAEVRRNVARSVARHRASAALGDALLEAELCLPHLEGLAPGLSASLRRALVARHDGLRHDLNEVIRKHDYRFREALSDGEKASLRGALELLGAPDPS